MPDGCRRFELSDRAGNTPSTFTRHSRHNLVLKEEATLSKVMLALARSSLVAAFCCSVSFAQPAETSRVGTASRQTGADSRLPQSPRELLKRGKDLGSFPVFMKSVRNG